MSITFTKAILQFAWAEVMEGESGEITLFISAKRGRPERSAYTVRTEREFYATGSTPEFALLQMAQKLELLAKSIREYSQSDEMEVDAITWQKKKES